MCTVRPRVAQHRPITSSRKLLLSASKSEDLSREPSGAFVSQTQRTSSTSSGPAAGDRMDLLLRDAQELSRQGRVFEALAALDSLTQEQSSAESDQMRLQLRAVCVESKIALSGLEESESWACVKEDGEDGLTVHYSRSGTVHSIRFSADYQCECSMLLAFAREFDLMMGWNKYTPLTSVLAVPSLLECVCYGEVRIITVSHCCCAPLLLLLCLTACDSLLLRHTATASYCL